MTKLIIFNVSLIMILILKSYRVTEIYHAYNFHSKAVILRLF